MARESKTRRDARRFGRPERLADMMIQTPCGRWKVPPFCRGWSVEVMDGWFELCSLLQRAVNSCPKYEISNVASYFYGQPGEEVRPEDFPSCVSPHPECFLEFAADPAIFPSITRAGWTVRCQDSEKQEVDPGMTPIDGARWYLNMMLVVAFGDRVGLPACREAWGITEDGFLVGGRALTVYGGHSATQEEQDDFMAMARSLVWPALMAFSFLNCRNVSTISPEPDERVNRERRKAGLKPFVRYHTINIEPMKAVLRTEGGVEHNGLKRALHICRGHFATYTEARPLFGRVAGTVWRPAHVRGSVKQGVVISDYNVNPPKAGS